MTTRERILAVYNGRVPDQVPFMLDLSHYYYERFQKNWDLCNGYALPEYDLIDFNKEMNAGFYMPNQAIFFDTKMDDSVKVLVERREIDGRPEIVWRYDTPIGSIERIRIWEPGSYSWAIKKWGVTTEQDLKVLAYAMSARSFMPLVENFKKWDDYVGDNGVIYLSGGYSAIGYLLNYWMGVEGTVYAAMDWPDTMRAVVDQINENNLQLVKMLSKYPNQISIMGDNISSDVQSPAFFEAWSSDFYGKAIDLYHGHGKKVAVHVDGKLKNAIAMVRDLGADAIDAVTPGSVGGYTPAQCRSEAGEKLILSGGIPNELWLKEFPMAHFEQAVLAWLALREQSPALISAAGDQVPPKAEQCRIRRMQELVNRHGGY